LFRCANFIDGGYLDNAIKESGIERVDYSLLSSMMSGDIQLLRSYYYHCLPYRPPKPTDKAKLLYDAKHRLFQAIELSSNYEVRLGKLERIALPEGGFTYIQKRVDILLGVDLVMLASKRLITHANILAGDSDFIPAIEVAKNEGVVVRLYSLPKTTSDLLVKVDTTIFLSKEFMAKVEMTAKHTEPIIPIDFPLKEENVLSIETSFNQNTTQIAAPKESKQAGNAKRSQGAKSTLNSKSQIKPSENQKSIPVNLQKEDQNKTNKPSKKIRRRWIKKNNQPSK
jgi:uncharacterized LabA/DUF88 family protein